MNSALNAAARLLQAEGVEFPPGVAEGIDRHLGLIREWNRVASLVSTGDADRLMEEHVVDSLSLAALVNRWAGDGGWLLDIGSGAGFPAIPIGLVLPRLRISLVERSERKCGFLRKVVAALGLAEVTVLTGEFPRVGGAADADVITARAVEKPAKVLRSVLDAMGDSSVFLCQSGDPRQAVGGGYQILEVDDGWTREGLRRGRLFEVRRA
ncbi:MAG: class I SAM-dependent methyltransferase [Candidatus Hydrogenedentes bacterium]|nr:class I SAM-dependent methyltransferase [Candidatus Hydrogenedentota bacterium]